MINLDEDALICDLAETYHIFDYMSHSVKLIATLSVGLGENSRIKLQMANSPADTKTLLLAVIADRIEAFHYGFTEDASKGKNKPVSIVDAICGNAEKKNSGVVGFNSVEEFEAALAKFKGE